MHRGESPHSSPANSPSSQKSPQSATGFFGFCAVLQSFQEKTNSSSLTLQGTPLKLPHPITKVLGEGGMGFGEGREKPLLPPLWGFFRKVLPPFPNFLSLLPVTQKLAAQQARVEIGRLGNKMRLADTDAEPGKPLVGDAAGIAGLVLVHKKPVERLPRRAAPDPAP